jgi:predicted ester cyclase
VTAPDPFVALMRRYVVDYTNRHDTSLCAELMEPDYTLRMGPHVVAGRDDAYLPAAQAQFRQFPGLGLTVHEIVTNGERLAMRFSEHGASVRHGGAVAVWTGIGLYRWNGRRLVENVVEQDYLGRRRQLAAARGPDPVEPPAPAPWDTRAVAPDPAAEDVVRGWIADGLPARPAGQPGRDGATDPVRPAPLRWDGVRWDGGRGDRGTGTQGNRECGQAGHGDGSRGGALDGGRGAPLIDVHRTVVDVLFSAGDRVAFRLTQHGAYRGGLDGAGAAVGTATRLHLVGLVRVADGRVAGGNVVRDRLGLARALARAGEPAVEGRAR